jgi:hypothetical protein
VTVETSLNKVLAHLLVQVDAQLTCLAITRETLEDHFIRITSEADATAA